jgi:hypothetical protein
MCIGPGNSNTAAPDAITPVKMRNLSVSSDAIYGAASGSAAYITTEEAFNVQVTVAGTLSLQWAQNTSDASNTNVQAGSAFVIKQIAA